MDSKHRHEFEQNELAKWITALYEGWLRPNSSWLGYAVLGVLIAAVVIVGTKRVNAWNQASAWKQYYAALHSEQADTDLEMLANSTTGIVGIHARLALAQRQLTEGCAQVFINKAQSIAVLEKAITSFQQVQKKTSDPSLLQQAGFGLGQCWETLAAARVGGDDLAKAEEEYQKVAERWGDSFVGKRAQKQLALLRQPSTKMVIELLAAKTIEPSETDNIGWNFDFADPIMPGEIDLGAFGEMDKEIKIEETENEDTETEATETEPVEPEPEI